MHDRLGLFINGTWRTETAEGELVLNPADESELGRLPHASPGDLDDAIDRANALSYGLAPYAFTQSAETAERLTSETEAGGVPINTAAPMYADAPSAASRTAASVTRAA